MTVKYATQVLSETVAENLRLWNPDAKETSNYCLFMDKFFDCFNIRYKKGTKNVKRWLLPFESKDDERLKWLKESFLPYFVKWEKNVQSRPGKFTKNDRARMFLSRPTYEGLKISIYSLVEIVPFLLNEGFDYILTERFCQDISEEHFGDQRKLGGRAENPDVRKIGHQTNALRIQKSVTCHSGNTKGRYDSSKTWESYSSEPLMKRKYDRKKK